MEDASAIHGLDREDVTPQLLEALLSGASSKRVEELASRWTPSDGPKLLAALCGLRLPAFSQAVAEDKSALKSALAKVVETAKQEQPMDGTLQTLPPLLARQVMTRVSQLYNSTVCRMISANSKSLSPGLLQLLIELKLLSGSPLRSLRQVSSAAGLGAMQALLAERSVARATLTELQQQQSTLMAGAGDASAAMRLARLCRAIAQVQSLAEQLDSEVQAFHEGVLLVRLQDVAPMIRRFTLSALGRYMKLKFLWLPERILRAFHDPSSEVRLQAIEVAGAWFEAEEKVSPTLAPQVAPCLSERSHDTDPRVAAAAVRQLRNSTLAAALSDDHFAMVAKLALTAPDSHGLLRAEAALFVEQHLLPEPGLGIASKKQPGEGEEDDLEKHFTAEHGLIAVADFLTSYLQENDDSLHLSRRFVEALWLRTDCFRRWSALADLCLLGEGQGAARSVPCLPNRQRLALLFVLDAALNCAEAPVDAVEALLPRLPRLFELFAAEGPCFLNVLSSISRRLICAACQSESEAPLPRALLPPLLTTLGTHGRIHGQLQLAEALSAWAGRSSEVQTAIRQLVVEHLTALELRLRSGGESATLRPLLALGQRGVDLWSCDKTGCCNKILYAALSVLEACGAQQQDVGLVPKAASELLELLVLLTCWRARSLVTNTGETRESAGLIMWCHLLRACCSKVLASEANLLLRFEAFSSYLLLLHLEFLGCKDLPKVPEDHLHSIDTAIADFYTAPHLTAGAWCQPAREVAGRDVTACRWLIDRYLHEADVPIPDSEVKSMVAASSSRMLAECEHEAIYTSSAAERLLQHLGHDLGDCKTESQVAAAHLLQRLRRYGGRSLHEACQGYQLQFRAAARHAKEKGLEAGLHLASTMIHLSTPAIIAGSRASTQLGRGLEAALKAYVAENGPGLDLEVLVPWLRDADCPLQGPAAQKLATQLAAEFGLLGQSITAHPQKRPRPWRLKPPAGVWPLITALQAIGRSELRRSQSWQVKMQATAKRRLAQRRRGVFRAPATEVEPKQEGWLAPLEKKCAHATPGPVKRKHESEAAETRRSKPRVSTGVSGSDPPKVRQWRLKDH